MGKSGERLEISIDDVKTESVRLIDCSQLVLFGYRVSYRRLLDIQARLLARHLLGELPDYPQFTPR